MSTPISPDDLELVVNFWREYVDGYIFNDLENCIRLAHANYPVALAEMCYVDFLGKLMTGKSNNSHDNFTTFVKAYLPEYASDSSFTLDELYGEVRSGLVHSYFPEKVDVVGVMKPIPRPPSIWRESGRWKIAVADFLDEFKSAAEALKQDLLKGKYLAEFKSVVLASPGKERIHTWPDTGGTPVASTSVTTVSGSVVFPPSKPPEP